MPGRCSLYISPAGTGKTTCVLALARESATGLAATPRVVVPTHLQVRAARRRLAEMGGAIGVHVMTFDRLYSECLTAAGEMYLELSEAVQYRLLQSVVVGVPLVHYASLADRPGFIQMLQGLVGEIKAAQIYPDQLAGAVRAMGDEPRLTELARIYDAYQARLVSGFSEDHQGWADRGGLGWLAVESMEQRASEVGRSWPLLIVDGFDSFTRVQLALLHVLAGRVGELIVTLTGNDRADAGSEGRPLAHRRFTTTRRDLEQALEVEATPLPSQVCQATPSLRHLERQLFHSEANRYSGDRGVELIEAPDRAAEARAALRWLKARLLLDGMRPGEVALLARTLSPYRLHILQVAAEFGLPVRLADGLPLAANPAITGLLDLLRLMLPGVDGQPSLPWRLVIEAWRSPYFDWQAIPSDGLLPVDGAPEPIGIGPGDADALDAAARWGRVIGGLAQWEEALGRLATRSTEATDDDERGVPGDVPVGFRADALLGRLRRFVTRLTPPPDARRLRDFVGWLEEIIGEDPALRSPRHPASDESSALRVVERARSGPVEIAEVDLAALNALKDVLRGLVWAEEAVSTAEAVDFPGFFADLSGAVEAATYRPPVHPDREEILISGVVDARGLPFRAVAVLGLAEGEFPATLGEDPFLRETDRYRLREEFGLPVASTLESSEAQFFYETVTRPRERLLLTRPRLADNGSPWQASPFWEEVRRLVDVEPERLTTESLPQPDQAASWPELMGSLASGKGEDATSDGPDASAWAAAAQPERWAALEAAVHVLRAREANSSSPFDGDLAALTESTQEHFGAGHVWSASRLETYRTCPFFFYVGHILGLEPRSAPSEGLDARQLGSIYHRILELTYKAAHNPVDLASLMAVLPDVAQRILDEAPAREGFRATAWWAQTRAAITENVRCSLEALAALGDEFVPIQFEAPFWGRSAVTVSMADGSFKLHGYIDRVDRASDGRLRIIDYKTGGPWSYTKRALAEGKKLQLPLYALAARDALGLGTPVEGFYWHIQHAQHSEFTLSGADGGPSAAMARAAEHAWQAVNGVREGRFASHAPADGCPDYCAAAGFCWHYEPRFRD